jgi:hypothetical protein
MGKTGLYVVLETLEERKRSAWRYCALYGAMALINAAFAFYGAYRGNVVWVVAAIAGVICVFGCIVSALETSVCERRIKEIRVLIELLESQKTETR